MKQTLLQFSIFFFASMLAFQAQGQVTITIDDFPRQGGFIDSLHFTSQAGIAVPTEGPNQVWNYSSLEAGEFRSLEYFYVDDFNFPQALNYHKDDLNFQGYAIESNAYERFYDDYFSDYGRSITEVTHSLTALTGSPNDKLFFWDQKEVYHYVDGYIKEIVFPMTYLDTWTNSREEEIKFELTIADYGMTNVSGKRTRINTQTRTVVGHGSLTIPKSDGSPSLPIDALLVKVERTYKDSFFLGGDEMPGPLLTLFGMIQGQTETATFYTFYTPGFAGRVLDIGLTGTGTAENASYRAQAADNLVLATKQLDLAAAAGFPNPVSAGAEMTITLEKPIASGYVSFTDLAGRQVFQTAFDSAGSNQVQIDIPSATGKGMYFYHVLDQKGIPVGLGKLLVN